MDATAQARAPARRIAATSLALSCVFALAKLVVGVLTGSLAILSDALQATLDVGTTAVTLYAVRLAVKPADREHPFGHGRAENLAALGQAGVLLVLGVFVGIEAVRRLASGRAIVPPRLALALILLSIVVDAGRVIVLRRAARRYDSQALEADSLNFSADVGGSIAVLAGLVAARLGFAAGDPLAALTVVALVVFMGARLGRAAVDVLMDRAPAGLEERLRDAAGTVAGVVDVGPVRVRKSGPHALAELEVHVGRTESVERSHDISAAVEAAIGEQVPGTSAVVRVAPTGEGEDVVRRVFAAANRVGLADQVHNVLAVSHPEGLWLMLHAKVDATLPLRRAHEITDVLEEELRREISGLSRVEIHLEPREPQALRGRVVTLDRADLTRELAATAVRHPPIERCHEVAVTLTDTGLFVVLHCEAPPHRSIEEIHAASLLVEGEIHRAHPEIAGVCVHFEPASASAQPMPQMPTGPEAHGPRRTRL